MWRSEGTKLKTTEILKCKTDGYYGIFHLQFTPLVIWSKFLMRLLSSFPSGRWYAEVAGQWTLLTWLIRPVPSSIQDQCWDKADCAGWSAPSQGNIWWDKTFLWPDYRNPVDFSYTLHLQTQKIPWGTFFAFLILCLWMISYGTFPDLDAVKSL